MADKLPKKVLFNNTEGISHVDFNEMQSLMQAYVNDGILSNFANHNVLSGMGGVEGHCFAMENACAVWKNVFNPATQLEFDPGVLAVYTPSGSITGDEPYLRTVYVDVADIPDKTRPVPGVSDRWDVLSVNISEVTGSAAVRDFKDAVTGALSTQSFDKRDQTQANFTWTQGVEGGGIPATPAGDVRICAVLVPAAGSITAEDNKIRDYRIPIGQTQHHVHAGADLDLNNSGATVLPNWPAIWFDDNGGFAEVQSLCPVAKPATRLLHIFLSADVDTVGSIALDIRRVSDNVTVEHLFHTHLVTPGTSSPYSLFTDPDMPIWANGYSAGRAAEAQDLPQLGISARWRVGGVLPATGGVLSDNVLRNIRWVTVG